MHAEAGSREYAQLALKSIITLNAGVAVAYPAVVELFLENITISEFIWPVLISAFGAVLGIICAYTAYFNYQFEAQVNYTQMELEVTEADEYFDKDTYYRFEKHREQTKEHWKNWNRKYAKRRDLAFYIATLFGFLSVVCFMTSTIWFAVSVWS